MSHDAPIEPGQDPRRCGHCGREAIGYAFINDQRYCHHRTRHCYELAQAAEAGTHPLLALNAEGAAPGD
jgi:hypothetical protein